MKIAINVPVMARAVRIGDKGERRLLVSHVHNGELRCVSPAETEVAFESVTARSSAGFMRRMRQFRVFAGKLYRPVGVNIDSGCIAAGAFDGFGVRCRDAILCHDGNFDAMQDMNPVVRPMRAILEDRLEAMAMDGSDGRNRTWPKYSGGYSLPNEEMPLEKALGGVRSVDQTDLEESFAMHRAISDRLLMVDDEVWMESGPPCIAVRTTCRAAPSKCHVDVRVMLRPDTRDHNFATVYYPVGAWDRALEDASYLSRRYGMAGVTTDRPDFDGMARSLADSAGHVFDFDPVEDIVDRTGHALSVNLLKAGIQRPDRFAEIDIGQMASVADRFAEGNPLLGRGVDYAAMLPRLAENFLAVSPHKATGLAELSYNQLRKAVAIAVDRLDELPVNLQVFAPSASPGP